MLFGLSFIKTLLRASVYPLKDKKTEAEYDLIIQINKLIIIGSAMKESPRMYLWLTDGTEVQTANKLQPQLGGLFGNI